MSYTQIAQNLRFPQSISQKHQISYCDIDLNCKWWLLSCRHVINTFLLIYQLGTCCVYVVFVSSNIKSIVDYYTEEKTDVRLYMLIILLPLILINWVRNLKYLAPFSTIANFITLISFGIILYYIFREPISFDGLVPVGKLRDFPLFFGTVLFALEAIGVVSIFLMDEIFHLRKINSLVCTNFSLITCSKIAWDF